MTERVLVVDDDRDMCRLLESGLRTKTIEPVPCSSGAEALERFEVGDVDVVITDIRMRGTGGLELCRHIAQSRPDVPVIVITAFGSMETAVEAIRAGAYDFVTKPFDLGRIRLTVDRALRHRELHRRLFRLEEALGVSAGSDEVLLGNSPPMQRLRDIVRRVADSDVTILITGESGTGKELVARSLHDKSARAAQPFMAVNCAAMPAPLLESELFGHVRGAFTDARSDRVGLFQAAGKGTLFLDEVGELPLELQPKLLRALQEKRIRRVGSNEEIAIEARIVAATNRDLESAVEKGRFREDLYYRLHVVDIPVPPLRQRGNDALLLAQTFISRYSAAARRSVTGLTHPAAQKIVAYGWPGNVRELQNCMERAVTLTSFNEITTDDLPDRVRDYEKPTPSVIDELDAFVPMEEIERRYLLRVFEATDGNKSLAAKILGLNRKTLYRKLLRYGAIQSSDDAPDSE